MVDGITGYGRQFTYDTLNRLTSATDIAVNGPTVTPATGTVTISGSEQYGNDQCQKNKPGCQSFYDFGSITIYINGTAITAQNYQQGSTSTSLASSLASAMNGNTSSPVTATVASSVITLTSKTGGVTGNSYSLSTLVTYDTANFASASFTASTSGPYLTGGSGNPPPVFLNETYTYDPFGNLIQAGNFGFSQSFTSLNQISGYSYDADGNQNTDIYSHALTFDANGMLSSVAGGQETYVYDAQGNRVEVHGSSVTDYVYFGGIPIATLNGGAYATDLIYAGGTLIAEVGASQSAVPTYHMTDSLGSLTSVNYAPYGQTFSGSTSDAFGFTGLQSDATTALYHATFRQFSSQQGRWQSPDPYAGSYDWSDPQSLNRYAYVNGRPMFGTDPSGLFTDGAVDPDYVPPSIWATIGPIAPPVAIFGAMLDIADLVTDLLNRTDFHGSIQPRPSAGVWNDKFGVPYGGLTNGIQQALGLPTMADISPIFDATAGNRSGFESLFCLGDALKSNGVSLALDAVGLIPAGGSASAAFSLFHGAAGVSNGTNILNRVKMGAGIIGTAGSGASNNWLGIATGAASIGASLGKAAPVYGQVLSLGALGVDAYKTYKAQSACVDSGKYD